MRSSARSQLWLALGFLVALLGMRPSVAMATICQGPPPYYTPYGQPTQTCQVNGFSGRRYEGCPNNPNCVPTGTPQTGKLKPKFLILSVIYASPGAEGCTNRGKTTYGAESEIGSKISASKSFQNGTTVTLTASGSFFGAAEVGGSFGASQTEGSSTEVELKSTDSYTYTLPGPCRNGLDHDEDVIVVLLGPELSGSLYPSGVMNTTLTSAGATVPLTVGQLKGTRPIDVSLSNQLAYYGIDTGDFATMLSADPLAFLDPTEQITPDPARFVLASTPTTWYSPTATLTQNVSLKQSMSNSSTMSASHDYNVGLSIEGGADFFGLVTAKLKVARSWTWSSTNARTSTTMMSTTASYETGIPTASYRGTNTYRVYYDTVYRTYAFVPFIYSPSEICNSVTVACPQAAVKTVNWGPGRWDSFAMRTNGVVAHKWVDGGGWQPSSTTWESLGGTLVTAPSVVSWGVGRLDLFGQGMRGQCLHKAFTGTYWAPSMTDWEDLGGVFAGPLTAVSWGANRLDIFGRGIDRAYFHKAWQAVGWIPDQMGWLPLGGQFKDEPVAVSRGVNSLDVFGRGLDDRYYRLSWNGSTWDTWTAIPGTVQFTSPPIVINRDGVLHVIGKGTDGAYYHQYWNSAWGWVLPGWENLGGILMGTGSGVREDAATISVFGQGGDGNYYFKKRHSSGYWLPSTTGWDRHSGWPESIEFLSKPDLITPTPGRLDVFGRARDGKVYQQYWDGSAWRPTSLTWYDLGAP